MVLKMNMIAINKDSSKLKIGALKCQTHHIQTVSSNWKDSLNH